MRFCRQMPQWKKDQARALRWRMTPAEWVLWKRFKARQMGCIMRRQVAMLGYIADFYCPEGKLIIEADGPYHENKLEYDTHRDKVFEARGFKVLRFRNETILKQTERVIQIIRDEIERRARPGHLKPMAA